MNGRVYSPKLAKFLSPDPVTQAPENGQNYNRYSYVFNNPLKYTDPSGYEGAIAAFVIASMANTIRSLIGGATSCNERCQHVRRAVNWCQTNALCTQISSGTYPGRSSAEVAVNVYEGNLDGAQEAIDRSWNISFGGTAWNLRNLRASVSDDATPNALVDDNTVVLDPSTTICRNGCTTLSTTGSGSIFVSAEGGAFFAYDSDTSLVHRFNYVAIGGGLGFGGAVSIELGQLSETTIGDLTGFGLAVSAFASAKDGVSGQVFGSGPFNDSGTIGGSVGYAGGLGAGVSGLFTYTSYQESAPVTNFPELMEALGL